MYKWIKIATLLSINMLVKERLAVPYILTSTLNRVYSSHRKHESSLLCLFFSKKRQGIRNSVYFLIGK